MLQAEEKLEAVESNRSWSQASLAQMEVIQLSKIGTKEAFAEIAGASSEIPRHCDKGDRANERMAVRHSVDNLALSAMNLKLRKGDIRLKTGSSDIRRDGLGVDSRS